jgi:parvulin-like peptidyl-prolyl isomerase
MFPIDAIEKRKFILFMGLLISACGMSTGISTPEIQASDTATISPIPTITETSIPPTPTPIPLAAIINGEEITLQEYESELHRFQSAQSEITTIQIENNNQVLEDIIIQVLLAQGAIENGYTLDEETLNDRMNELISALGGQGQFEQWLQDNQYTPQDFRLILTRSILGAWMRDQIISEVPNSAEQVHVYQILLYNSDQANQVLAELESGRDFATVAAAYSPVSKGNIGWFPVKFLPHPAIEEAAFDLQPGEFSQVIETSVGYHIIQVVDRDQNRPLSPEARLIWQEIALQEWVANQREQSEIIILIPQEGE